MTCAPACPGKRTKAHARAALAIAGLCELQFSCMAVLFTAASEWAVALQPIRIRFLGEADLRRPCQSRVNQLGLTGI